MNIKKIWEQLSNNGLKPDHDFNTAKRIRIINRFSIIGIYIALSYTVFLLFLSEPFLALLDFNIVIAGVLVMVLLKKFNYKVAAISMFITIPVTLMLLNMFYGRVGGEFYFYSLFILAYYIFPKRKYLVPILIYLVIMFIFSKHFALTINPIGMAKTLAPYFYYINVSCTFIIAAIFLQLFVNEHVFYQKKIEDAYQNVIVQNEKNTMLLKELNHRTKNNLQIISSLISLQSNRISDEKAKTTLEESNNRIHSLSLIYKKLYEKDDISFIVFKDYINELIEHYSITFDLQDSNTIFEQHIGDISIGIDDIASIGLLMNELITNAIKYSDALNTENKISIWATQINEHSLQIKIQNTGTGIHNVLNENAHSSFGTKLIHMLVNQMKGTIALDNKHDNCVEINIMLSHQT